jgi:hypothetical protein
VSFMSPRRTLLDCSQSGLFQPGHLFAREVRCDGLDSVRLRVECNLGEMGIGIAVGRKSALPILCTFSESELLHMVHEVCALLLLHDMERENVVARLDIP